MSRTRPISAVERDDCVRSAKELLAVNPLPPTVQSAFALEFVPAMDVYVVAVKEWRVTKAAHDFAIAQANLADAEFDRTCRRWVASVTDEEGKRASGALAKLLGGLSPGDLPNRPHDEEVNLTADLLDQVKVNPLLEGDSAKLAEFTAAHGVLAARVAEREALSDRKTQAVKDLATAERTFDLAWGSVVRQVKRKAPDLVSRLPVFYDVPAPDTDEEEKEAATEPATGATPPPETETETETEPAA